MSYQLYCIFRQPLPTALEIPDGVAGHRVFTAHYNGLGAALSKVPDPDRAPDDSKLLAYEKVVESFYRRLTVIPLRYGCRVQCPYDAVILLRENHDAYSALLRELEGLAKVGVQVLLDSPMVGGETDRLAIPAECFSPPRVRPRAPFSDTKKPRYPGAQWTVLVLRAWVENLCGSLHGSFVHHIVEFPPSRRSPLLFLVPCDSVEPFRQTTRHLPPNLSGKLLFSGLWPTYNFVDALPS